MVEKGQEIIGCLPEVFVVSYFGEGYCRREPFDRDAITSSLRGWDEDFIATVVFKRRSNIVAVDAMRGKSVTLCRCIMNDNFGTGHSERCSVEVEVSEEASVG